MFGPIDPESETKLNELKAAFAGTDPAKEAAAALQAIEKDPKARDQVKAAETVEKLEKAMEAKAFVDAYKGYKGLAKKFAGTKIEVAAKEKIGEIEKEGLLNYRSSCADCRKAGKTCTRHRA